MSRYSYAVPRSRDDAHEAIVRRKIGNGGHDAGSGSLDKVGDIAWSDFESALQHTKPSVAQSEEALGDLRSGDAFGSK